MTDSCDTFKAQIPELALGVLHGRERSDAIAHVEQCQACHEELLLMGGLADQLVELTPGAEPSAGFETRVLAAIASEKAGARVEDRAPTPITTASRRRRRWSGLIAAAAAVAVAFGIGGWALGRTGNHGGGVHSAVAAALVSHGQRMGEVVETTGDYPWVYMDVETNLGNRTVICELHERNGSTYKVGTFALKNGAGYWGSPLPPDAADATGAELVGANGQTLATASLS